MLDSAYALTGGRRASPLGRESSAAQAVLIRVALGRARQVPFCDVVREVNQPPTEWTDTEGSDNFLVGVGKETGENPLLIEVQGPLKKT